MSLSNKLPKGKAGGYLALSATSVLWGTTWVASKVAVSENLPPFQMASIRQFLGGVCFVGFFMLYKKMPLPTPKQFGWLVLLSLLMFVMANGLSTWSLKYIPTGFSALIGALYPFSVVIIERIFLINATLPRLPWRACCWALQASVLCFTKTFFTTRLVAFYLA